MRILPIAAGLALALWAVTLMRSPGGSAWVKPVDPGTGPARILRFYASAGAVAPGQHVRLCYAVENARNVRISPLFTGLYPAKNYCLEVAPEHTTHYTLLAEGYDGTVAARSFTLPVQTVPPTLSVNVPAVAGM